MKKTDLAWAAGLFDGEGCITLKRDYNGSIPTYSLRLVVVNTHLPALEELRLLFGLGSIRQSAPRSKKQKARWDWRVASRQAETVLRLLLPHLRIKREEAKIAVLSRKYQQKVGANTENPNKEQLEWLKRRLSDLKGSSSRSNR